jgi:UDP-N-acetylmuramoyl-tripeptide--D-alanyl-D-alanine ligase
MGSLLKTYKNAKKRKILVMGDMLELGKYTEKYHRDSAHLAKENGVEILLCIGEHTVYTVQEAREISLKAEHFDKLSELASRLKNITDEGDLVLIKGSRKMQMEKLKEYT